MQGLKDQIALLNDEEGQLLVQDELPRGRWSRQGLYLVVRAADEYTAYDFADRQTWLEHFSDSYRIPEGWVKDFEDPVSAIDWLLDVRKKR